MTRGSFAGPLLDDPRELGPVGDPGRVVGKARLFDQRREVEGVAEPDPQFVGAGTCQDYPAVGCSKRSIRSEVG